MSLRDLFPFGSILATVMLIEFILSWKIQWKNYCLKEVFSSLVIKHIEYVFLALYFVAFTPIINWVYAHRIFDFHLSGVFGAVFYLLLFELNYYWTHRFAHANALGWANHITHHSFTKLNIINGSRIGALSPFSLYYFTILPLFWLGAEPEVFFAYGHLSLIYQLFLHTELVPKLGYFDLVFNTPSNHRVHHGKQEIYKNKNFGSMFVIFDHLFGTYQKELEDVKPTYGLIESTPSQNPVRIFFLGWEKLIKSYWNRI